MTLTVTDGCGNNASCTAVVTVEDNQFPTTLCKNVPIYLDQNGAAMITPEDIDDGSSDNCLFTLSLDQTEFDCDDVGQSGPENVAYNGVQTVGNQAFAERLGMVFTVNNPAEITALGAFDDGQNGLSLPITVGIIRNSDIGGHGRPLPSAAAAIRSKPSTACRALRR